MLAARLGHDEEPRLNDLAGVDIKDDRACNDVDLDDFNRGMFEEDRGRCRLLVAPDEALLGVVAVLESVTLNEGLMDSRGLNAPFHPGADKRCLRRC